MPAKKEPNSVLVRRGREERVRLVSPLSGPPGPRNKPVSQGHPLLFNRTTDIAPGVTIYPSPSTCKGCSVCDFHFESKDSQQQCDGYVYEGSLSVVEAHKAIEGILKAIRTDRDYLSDRLQSHGDNLLETWWESDPKALSKRLTALAIEPKAWPQLNLFFKWDWGWHQKRKNKAAFLIPHVNIEALLKKKSRFLLLLLNRTKYGSSDYFWDDLRSLEFPIKSALIDKTFSPCCMETCDSKFGRICS